MVAAVPAQHVAAADCVGARLHVDVTNTRAMGLYVSHGFVVEDTIAGYYRNGQDAHVMVKMF